MRRDLSPGEARSALRTRSQLLSDGWGARDIERAIGREDVRRLQLNRYVRGALWDEVWDESRHLLQVMAAHSEMRDGGAVVSYESSGVLFGMPLYRHRPARVHVTLPEAARASSSAGVMRHRERLPEADITDVDGVMCTTLERTTYDVIRVVPRDAAVAFADAALRHAALRNGAYDLDAAAQWRARMRERTLHGAGARGIRQAIEVVDFADGRAEKPGESVTRLQLSRLGFSRFGLQVPVRRPGGNPYRVDLEIEDIATFVEFDGKGKYLDAAMRSGRTTAQVLLDEKAREDWIRGVTQKRFVRVEDDHIASARALARRLQAFGIDVDGAAAW